MRLTIEKDPEAIRRYRHLAPVRVWWLRRCTAECPGNARRCTREKEHRGPHISRGWLGRVLAVWDGSGSEVIRKPAPRAPRKSPVPGSPIGRKPRRPDSVWTLLRLRLRSVVSSPDQLIFMVLFAGFVAFAIQVLVSILL